MEQNKNTIGTTKIHQHKLFLECVIKELLAYANKICDRLWEKGAYGAENKNVVFNLF